MNKDIDVLTFGDVCVDLILSSKDIVPEFGQKEKLVDDYLLEMGGSCCIFACQTAKLGLKTVVVGKAGKDQFGTLVCNTLKDSGVLVDYIKVEDDEKTGISVALNRGNDRAILTYNGTIDALGIQDVSYPLLKRIKHLHIGSYFLMKKLQPYYAEIINKVKEYGVTVSLDTNWDPEEDWNGGLKNILPYIDILFLNQNEVMAITGCDNLEEAIKSVRKCISTVVIKLGENGSVAYSGDNVYKVDAIPGEVVDTIGAGDSFDGGFVYGYLNHKSIEECLMIGNVCGSLNVRKTGGVKGQPKYNDIQKYKSDLNIDKIEIAL